MRALPLLALVTLASCGSTGGTAPRPLQIDVGDLTFDGLAAGPEDGELVLLLHGFPQTAYSYRDQIPALAAAGYRAVAIDQRGYSPGARPEDVDAYVIPRLVEDVVGVADALGRERFHLVGHDWGSAVAWCTAMAHPDRVVTLTALSVPHPFAFARASADAESDQSRRSSYMATLRAEGAEQALLDDDAAQLRAVYADDLEPEAVERYVAHLDTPEALGAALNWYRAMGVPSSLPSVTPIAMPTLYVWSTDDASMSREGAELTAEYVEGPYRFEILEGVGHWIPEEATERLNEMLLEHMDSAEVFFTDSL